MSCISIFFLLALCATVLEADPTIDDARVFLSSSGEMWMLRRSFIRKNDRNEANSCVHIKKLSFNEGTFEYDHNHKEADKWQNIYIYVTLQESTDSDSDPRINVRSAKSESTKEYRLRYWDPQHHCAILTFIGTSNSQTECELYQWKDDIPGGIPQGCKDKFAQLCGRRKHTVNKDC